MYSQVLLKQLPHDFVLWVRALLYYNTAQLLISKIRFGLYYLKSTCNLNSKLTGVTSVGTSQTHIKCFLEDKIWAPAFSYSASAANIKRSKLNRALVSGFEESRPYQYES